MNDSEYTLNKIRAHSEVRTLLLDGYIVLSEATVNGAYYITLRNPRNKNRMQVTANAKTMAISKNGRIVKMVVNGRTMDF